MVNAQLSAYQQKFQSKNMTDIFSLVALNECMTIISLKRKQEALEKEVRKLQEDLEGYLKNIDKIQPLVTFCAEIYIAKSNQVTQKAKTGLGDPSGDSYMGRRKSEPIYLEPKSYFYRIFNNNR